MLVLSSLACDFLLVNCGLNWIRFYYKQFWIWYSKYNHWYNMQTTSNIISFCLYLQLLKYRREAVSISLIPMWLYFGKVLYKLKPVYEFWVDPHLRVTGSGSNWDRPSDPNAVLEYSYLFSVQWNYSGVLQTAIKFP